MVSQSHLPSPQAGIVSAVTFAVGQLVAFVPTLAPLQEKLISVGSLLLSLVFLIANSIHAHAASKQSVAPVPAVVAAARKKPAA